jgi:hypothetical protein
MTTAKVIEVISNSAESFDDALRQGIAQAAKTLHGISGVEVVNWTVDVENNTIANYKVTLHIAFQLDSPQ